MQLEVRSLPCRERFANSCLEHERASRSYFERRRRTACKGEAGSLNFLAFLLRLLPDSFANQSAPRYDVLISPQKIPF